VGWPLLITGGAIALGGGGSSSGGGVLLDAGLEVLLPGTNNSVDLLTVLNEEEGRHRLDLVL